MKCKVYVFFKKKKGFLSHRRSFSLFRWVYGLCKQAPETIQQVAAGLKMLAGSRYRNILYQVCTRNSDVIATLGAVTQMEDKAAKKQLVAATFFVRFRFGRDFARQCFCNLS